jgi:very-short-patch-repair endonuclease
VKFYTLTGKQKRVTRPYRYNIDWNGKSRSIMQEMVKEFLKEFWWHDIVFEEFPVAGSRMTFDFYNDTTRVAVEVQGRQHDEYVKYFHRNKLEFLKQKRRDADKREYCKINDIKLAEVRGEDKLSREIFKKYGVNL